MSDQMPLDPYSGSLDLEMDNLAKPQSHPEWNSHFGDYDHSRLLATKQCPIMALPLFQPTYLPHDGFWACMRVYNNVANERLPLCNWRQLFPPHLTNRSRLGNVMGSAMMGHCWVARSLEWSYRPRDCFTLQMGLAWRGCPFLSPSDPRIWI